MSKTNINEVEINGVVYVAKDSVSAAKPVAGDLWIVRTYSAGVFFGELVGRDGKKWDGGERGVVKNARRLWYWEGAASLSQLAATGTTKPKGCKFSVPVAEEHLTNIIEAIPCADEAIKSIQGVGEWVK